MKTVRAIFFITLLTLSSFHQSINAACKHKYLQPLSSESAQSSTTQNDVTIHAKRLNKKEVHAIFNGRGSLLFNKKNPIIPIQLTILNDSEKEIIFDPEHLHIPNVNQKEVLARLQYNTPARVTLLSLAGVGLSVATGLTTAIGLPLIYGGLSDPFVIYLCGLIYGIPVAFTTLTCTTAATIYYGCHYSSENKELAQIIDQNGSHAKIKIGPDQEFSMIIFADGNRLGDQFTVCLADQENDQLIPFAIETKK